MILYYKFDYDAMTSEVYFAPFRARKGSENLANMVTKLFEKAGFDNCISENDLTAIKVI